MTLFDPGFDRRMVAALKRYDDLLMVSGRGTECLKPVARWYANTLGAVSANSSSWKRYACSRLGHRFRTWIHRSKSFETNMTAAACEASTVELGRIFPSNEDFAKSGEAGRLGDLVERVIPAGKWPTQIIEFCARRAKECAAPLITAVESTQFASTQAVREAVSRFVTTGEVVPAHWLSQDGPTLHIGRRRTEGSISLSSWLEHFGADFHYGQELDQVLVGSSLLVALPEGASVSLERDLEDAPADGSFSHDRIRSESLAGSTRHRVLITMRVKEWSPKTVRLGFKESYPDVQESVRHLPINGKVWAARWFALHLAWRVRRWRSWSRFWLATVRPSRQTVRHDD